MNFTKTKKRSQYKREDLLTAIVICMRDNKVTGALKYHKIKNVPGTMDRFKTFVKTNFPDAVHINYYGGISKNFIERVKMQD